VKAFLSDVAGKLGEYTGVVASNYAREFSEAIVEEWARILIDGIVNKRFTLDDLADTTKARRKNRGVQVLDNVPLVETGLLISSIVFRIEVDPATKYHTIKVGIEDTGVHSDRSKKSVVEIAMYHEYGIGVPQRSFFEPSTSDIGYQEHRIFNKTFQEARAIVAQGYALAGVTRRSNAGYSLNTIERAVAAGKHDSMSINRVGRIVQSGSSFTFEWD
jgi:hypothetical protein